MATLRGVPVMIVAALLCRPAGASVQCCGGWGDQEIVSHDGSIKLKAEFPGGRGSHGPFRLKFTWEAQASKCTSFFEANIEATACCPPSIILSPASNGFLLRFWNYEAFYSWIGEVLYEASSPVGNSGGRAPSEEEVLSPDGFTVKLHKPKADGAVILREPAGRLFLPLGIVIGGDREQELVAALEEGWSGALRRGKEIEALLKCLEDEQVERRDRAEREIAAHGVVGIEFVARALEGRPSPEVRARLESILRKHRVWNPTEGVSLLRDVHVLATLLFYPEEKVASAARRHLMHILPARNAEALAPATGKEGWKGLQRHLSPLKWDPAAFRFLPD